MNADIDFYIECNQHLKPSYKSLGNSTEHSKKNYQSLVTIYQSHISRISIGLLTIVVIIENIDMLPSQHFEDMTKHDLLLYIGWVLYML